MQAHLTIIMTASQTSTDTEQAPVKESLLKVKPERKALHKVCCIFTTLMMFTVLALLVVVFMGDRPEHTHNPHPLLAAFEQSPPHRKLLTQISKGRLSVVYGRSEDGLGYFGQHVANQLVNQNQSVQFISHTEGAFSVESVVVRAKSALNSWIGMGNYSGVNILQWGSGEHISPKVVQQALDRNPQGRLIILAPSPQNLTYAKQYSFPELQNKFVEKVMVKSHKLKPKTANIIADYFQSHADLYEAMSGKKFNASLHLGQHGQKLKRVSSGDQKILDELCNKGISKSKEAGTGLEMIGVVRVGTRNYWLNRQVLFNYELQTDKNCVNRVATPQVLESIRVIKEKEEELRVVKTQEIKKVEEEEVNIVAQKVAQQKQFNQKMLAEQKLLQSIETRLKEMKIQQKKLKAASQKKEVETSSQTKAQSETSNVKKAKKGAKIQAEVNDAKPKKQPKAQTVEEKPVIPKTQKGQKVSQKKAQGQPTSQGKGKAKGKVKGKKQKQAAASKAAKSK